MNPRFIVSIFVFLSIVYIFPYCSYAQGTQNLLENSGFEEVDSGTKLPSHWETRANLDTSSASTDTTEKHEGNASWKFTVSDSSQYREGKTSEFILVEKNVYYELSLWARSSDGTPQGSVGWIEYDQNKQVIATESFVIKNTTISKSWKKYSGIIKPQNKNTKFVKPVFYGPYKSVGNVWWDEVRLVSLGSDWFRQYGCLNSSVSKCIDFGSENEAESGITYTSSAMTDQKTDGAVGFRSIKPKQKVTLTVPAFNVDSNGLPISPMMLEVRFRDTIDDTEDSDSVISANHRAFMSSFIDYKTVDPLSTSKNKESMQFMHLGGQGDNIWTFDQYFFDKTPFQFIRAINGTFTFTIQMPGNVSGDNTLELPIDYISLQAVTSKETETYQSKKRDLYGFQLFANPPDAPNPPVTYADPVLSTFVRNSIQSIYLDTKPKLDEVDKPIEFSSARGEVEAVNMGIYSENGVSDVTVSIDDLKHSDNATIIPRDMVTVYQVVSAFRRLNQYGDPNLKNTYSFIPDRIEPLTSSLSFVAAKSGNIWLKFHIPAAAPGGTYESAMKFTSGGSVIKTIPIRITILPLVLDHSINLNPVYHDPYIKTFFSDNDEVFRFYKETGLDPFITLTVASGDIKLTKQSDQTIDINIDLLTQRLQKMAEKGFMSKRGVIELAYVWQTLYRLVYPGADKTQFYAQLSESAFTEPFAQIVQKIANAGRERGFEFIFSVADEPCDRANQRIVTDRLYEQIKKEGYATTTSYYSSCEKPLSVDIHEYVLPDELNQSIPPLTNKVDYKVWALRFQDDGYDKQYAHFGYYTTAYSYLRNPIYNRFAHGILAYSTEAEVVSAYAMGDIINDPFNDFDATPKFRFPFTYPDFIYAYPSWGNKLIESLNGEGLREGIQDAKYIATLERLIGENKESPASIEAKKYLDELKQKIDPHFYNSYVQKADEYGFGGAILESIAGNPTDYSAFTSVRSCVIFHISHVAFPEISTGLSCPYPSPTCSKKQEGDADCNDQITINDFEQWRSEFTGVTSSKDADFNSDSIISATDFEIWRRSFLK